MGEIAKPICRSCGYTPKDVCIGAGMFNFRTSCSLPAADFDTNEIVTLDYFEKAESKKGNYVFYTEPEMFIKNDETRNLNWFNHKIQATGNFCPKCKNYDLEFISYMHFD